MPKIPKTKRTISQVISSQLPDFVVDDYPKFTAFLTAYYEWLETNGVEIFSCKLVGSSQATVRLTDAASSQTNAYEGMNLVLMNGPRKGYCRKIRSYDPETNTVTLETPWDYASVPEPNTLISINDTSSPGQLLEYRDIDTTLDRFVNFFRTEFLYQIPGTVLADKRHILKHIKEFYQARGTEDSFRFLFRILFNEELEMYYPRVDLFRPSDARWSVENVMCAATTGDTFDYVNRQLIGVSSGATARVESATQRRVANQVIMI